MGDGGGKRRRNRDPYGNSDRSNPQPKSLNPPQTPQLPFIVASNYLLMRKIGALQRVLGGSWYLRVFSGPLRKESLGFPAQVLISWSCFLLFVLDFKCNWRFSVIGV